MICILQMPTSVHLAQRNERIAAIHQISGTCKPQVLTVSDIEDEFNTTKMGSHHLVFLLSRHGNNSNFYKVGRSSVEQSLCKILLLLRNNIAEAFCCLAQPCAKAGQLQCSHCSPVMADVYLCSCYDLHPF